MDVANATCSPSLRISALVAVVQVWVDRHPAGLPGVTNWFQHVLFEATDEGVLSYMFAESYLVSGFAISFMC